VNVLVTGADGFAGGWLVRRLLADGHQVTGAAGRSAGSPVLTEDEARRVAWIRLDLADPGSVEACANRPADQVFHLAGVSSVRESLEDPAGAWVVNALGTARLIYALGRQGAAGPRVLVVSTGEVYGRGRPRPRTEGDRLRPVSPYAASKAAAEVAALEGSLRTGLPVIVARPFPHTGPGQATRFVVPAFAARLLQARRDGSGTVKVGNLEPVRDLLDVRDVVEAYLALLRAGETGEVYNVASGQGIALERLFRLMAELVGHPVQPEHDPSLARPVDIPHLVGDASKLRAATGWAPRHSLDQTLHLLLHASAH
jgi:GDP-4-dehydro-6-deoxy-D-mannose reductase